MMVRSEVKIIILLNMVVFYKKVLTMEIKKIYAREILDSRGNPAVEVDLFFGEKTVRASVPSGASVGKGEAFELRDGDRNRYDGKGVLRAVENIEKIIAPTLVGKKVDIEACDKIMLELDGTKNKEKLGANAILPVSIAILRAQALLVRKEDYQFIQKFFGAPRAQIPKVMFNVLNGGAHADNSIDFQEFMIMPMSDDFSENLHAAVAVYKKLKRLLADKNLSTGVGDEGGFAPKINERQALDFLLKAVELAGLKPGVDVVFCLDVASSRFFLQKENKYLFGGEKLSSSDMIDFYKKLVNKYPIYSIEDGLSECDWDGFKMLTEELGEKALLVGDDIFVTNPEKIKKGIEVGVANSVLIKPNQIGTVTQCLNAIKICHENNYKTVVSHRSGETNDYFISDLAVGVGSQFFKAGAPARGERVAKYNRLAEIGSF